jgi:hypothetical protein
VLLRRQGARGLQSRGARVSVSEEPQSKRRRERSRLEQGGTLALVAGSSRGVCERGAHEARAAARGRRATPCAVCSRHSARSPFPMLEGEGSCAQPQASKPAETLAQTTPQGGRGPPAGSSQAGGGSVERRRSSVVVVALGQHHEKKGAAAVVVEQARLTLMALGLALMMAPVAATIEPLVEFFLRALPNFMPSAPCQGLLMDRRGVDLVVLGALAFLLLQIGFQAAAVDANPRASRLLLHTMLVGVGASVACPVWYASAVASLSPLQVIAYGFLTGFVVTLTPFVSFAVWGVATAERRNCKRAAEGIVYGVILSATTVPVGCATTFYVALSDQVSGFAGVAINGKGRWHDDAGVGKHLTRVTGRLSVQASYTRLFNSGFEVPCSVFFEGKCLEAP